MKKVILFILLITFFVFNGISLANNSQVNGNDVINGGQSNYVYNNGGNTGGINTGEATASYDASVSNWLFTKAKGKSKADLNLTSNYDPYGNEQFACRISHVNSQANTNTYSFFDGSHYHDLSISGRAFQNNQSIIDHGNGNFAGGYNESSASYNGRTINNSNFCYGFYSETDIFGEANTVGFTKVKVNKSKNHANSKAMTFNHSYTSHTGKNGIARVSGNGFTESASFVGNNNVSASSYASGEFSYSAMNTNHASGVGYNENSTTADINVTSNSIQASSTSSSSSFSSSFNYSDNVR